MSGPVSKFRFRFSLGALMIVIAVCAFLLVPAVWMLRLERQRRQLVLAAFEAEHRAKLEAERARYVATLNLAQTEWTAAAQAAAKTRGSATDSKAVASTLWAMVSVNHPVFDQEDTKNLSVEFTLVNDGQKPLDPTIGESRIQINGKELDQSSAIIGESIPKEARDKALAPGESLRFSCVLGKFFQAPGIYRITWVGRAFRSPDAVVRVLPAKATARTEKKK